MLVTAIDFVIFAAGTDLRLTRAMFGLGLGELLVVAAALAIFFYARRLPDLARALTKTASSFRDGLRGPSERARSVRDVEPLDDGSKD